MWHQKENDTNELIHKKSKKKELIHKTETDSQRTNLGLPGVGGEG